MYIHTYTFMDKNNESSIEILLVTGGTQDGLTLTDSTEIYNIGIGSWNIAEAKLPRPMDGLRATNIDDMVLIFGI